MRNTIGILSKLANSLANGGNPCTQGVCTVTTLDYSITIRGPPNAIGDLTEAGGWDITGCSAGLTSQAVVAVCRLPGLCLHVLDGTEVGKIVLLPDGCGPDGFARITHWQQKETSTSGEETYDLKFDNRIHEVPQRSGPVTFSITGASHDVNEGKLNRRFMPDAVKRVYLKSLNIVDKPVIDKALIDLRPSFPIKTYINDIPLLGGGFGCEDDGDSSFSANASVAVDLHFSGGFAVIGSIIPPRVKAFQMYGKLNGTVTGRVDIRGSAMGSIKPDEKKLLNIPVPLFPGIPFILSVGPKLQLAVQPEILVNGSLENHIEFGYQAKDIRLFFPEGQDNNKNHGSFEPIETEHHLKLGSGTAEFQMSIHLMPRFAFGFDIVGHSTEIFFEIDITGIAGIQLEHAQSNPQTEVATAEPASESSTSWWDTIFSNDVLPPGPGDVILFGRSAKTPRVLDALEQLNITGCAYVRLGVALNVGASFEFLLHAGMEPESKVSLFSYSQDLVQTCSKDAQQAKTKIPSIEQVATSSNSVRRRSPGRGRASRGRQPSSCKPLQAQSLLSIFSFSGIGLKLAT